jgi:xanthine dehydrogenase YagS FAD-binding subunit
MRPIRYLPVAEHGDAIAALSIGDAMLLAGGTNLVDLMRIGVVHAAKVVDVNALRFANIEPEGNGLRIGALVRNADLAWDSAVRARYPVLSQALLSGASAQIRNMATVGGNMLQRTRCPYFRDVASPCNKRQPGSGCGAMDGDNRMHAVLGTSDHCIATSPSDMCVALAALDAVVVLAGPRGERRVPFVDFHVVPGETPHVESVIAKDEIIVALSLPLAPWAVRSRYLKVRERDSFAFALASVAVGLEVHDGSIVTARLALGGVATKPWRAKEAEDALVGKAPSDALFRDVAELVMKGAKPRKHNAFKVQLAKRTIARGLRLAWGAAGAPAPAATGGAP